MKKAFDILFKIGRAVNIVAAGVFGLLFLINFFGIQDPSRIPGTIVFALLTGIEVAGFILAGKAHKKFIDGKAATMHYVVLFVAGAFNLSAYTLGALFMLLSEKKTNSSLLVSEPLVRLTKRDGWPVMYKVLVYAIMILASLLVGCIILALIGEVDFFEVIENLVNGAFGTERRVLNLMRDFALLLGVSAAIVPAFRMKFWNLGANGQILMGGLAAMFVMHNLGRVNDIGYFWRLLLIIAASVTMGAVWAVIPAIFKALFKTNESLFTLMMNYIAVFLVNIAIAVWEPGGSGVINSRYYRDFGIINDIKGLGGELFKVQCYLPMIVVGVITAVMIIYLRFSKHGYEISVVGESEKTAKYIGVNDKKVVIRTMILSGAICGVIGMILVSAINFSIISDVNGSYVTNLGFTAIMTVWLANCNPIAMIGTCFYVAFLSEGMKNAATAVHISNQSTINVIIGVIYFFIIACSFFINYKIHFGKRRIRQAAPPVADKADLAVKGGANNG